MTVVLAAYVFVMFLWGTAWCVLNSNILRLVHTPVLVLWVLVVAALWPITLTFVFVDALMDTRRRR